jgi:hypothetical protein
LNLVGSLNPNQTVWTDALPYWCLIKALIPCKRYNRSSQFVRILIIFMSPEINDHANFQWSWGDLNSWSLRSKFKSLGDQFAKVFFLLLLLSVIPKLKKKSVYFVQTKMNIPYLSMFLEQLHWVVWYVFLSSTHLTFRESNNFRTHYNEKFRVLRKFEVHFS